MLLMRAIVRPEKKDEVLKELSVAGFPAATVVDVVGRGKQKGIKVGNTLYDEIPKSLVMVVIHDEERERFVDTVLKTAKTGEDGNFGDGKIFITPVEEVYTISRGGRGL
ncbi:P-II family nitrogen regulator [Methanospirillum sp. J.3.6.1-F.2.7.3]|uniref:P-II family nitrogen regulator n=2 Tax=Methanospirillum TaxID=2202 RepID=A0A8E7AY99_9EURY|nr:MULTISPECIES: P-II family nitrogen regulator [Methanospirillum]MDX8551676.1 P-II family nitrogen regulator [Methanospirillum hungatei]NLW77402.1 P-II family nitrogen regulator [Methanomicrobiales archaeon]QVV87668.1 P-II family nitrogen regulator [Methanospirillum sp. J.3.6.1-F.2.7.3]QXO95222.1 P-II family nitrogen regulator [Methanospirillum hungatei]